MLPNQAEEETTGMLFSDSEEPASDPHSFCEYCKGPSGSHTMATYFDGRIMDCPNKPNRTDNVYGWDTQAPKYDPLVRLTEVLKSASVQGEDQ